MTTRLYGTDRLIRSSTLDAYRSNINPGKEQDRWLARLRPAIKNNPSFVVRKKIKLSQEVGWLPGYTRVYGSKGLVPNLRKPGKTISNEYLRVYPTWHRLMKLEAPTINGTPFWWWVLHDCYTDNRYLNNSD